MLKIILVLILALRVSLFFLPSFHIDMGTWEAWAFRLVNSGIPNFYSPNFYTEYFPGYLYILWLGGHIFTFLSKPIISIGFEIFIKSVTTLFDIGSAVLIYKIVFNYNKAWAKFSPILYLLNPAIIFNSSVWGQVEGFFTFFLLFSSYYLIERKHILKSSIMIGLAIITKPQALSFLPTWLLNNPSFTLKSFTKVIVILFLILILFSLPFFTKNPIFGFFQFASNSLNLYQYTSLYAFNFWALIGWWKPDNTLFIVSYKTWGLILYLTSIVLISLPVLKKKINPKRYYFTMSLALFSFFLFLTRMHERYLFPFLAFILITALIRKSRFLFLAYIVTSIIHLINLWFVYYYYNFVYNNPNLTKNTLYVLYIFINDNYKIFSVIMLISFFSLLFIHYKPYVKKNKAKLAS